MKCPYCGSNSTRVVDKRDSLEDLSTRRRRSCMKCFKRFTTYERVEVLELKVIKKNGQMEQFDREKLKRGLMKAVDPKRINEDQVMGIIDDVEMKLLNRKTNVVKSCDIGRLVLHRLRLMDPVAYMRFASVYKNFESLEDFKKELELINEIK